VTTNLAFLEALLRHPQVVRGEIDTGFIEREMSDAHARVAPSLGPLDSPRLARRCLLREQASRSCAIGLALGSAPTAGRSLAAAAAA
jgi:acetyl/propionyl-CoA carboxylase alpha subunit